MLQTFLLEAPILEHAIDVMRFHPTTKANAQPLVPGPLGKRSRKDPNNQLNPHEKTKGQNDNQLLLGTPNLPGLMLNLLGSGTVINNRVKNLYIDESCLHTQFCIVIVTFLPPTHENRC